MNLERAVYYIVVLVAIVLCGWFALEIIDRLMANT